MLRDVLPGSACHDRRYAAFPKAKFQRQFALTDRAGQAANLPDIVLRQVSPAVCATGMTHAIASLSPHVVRVLLVGTKKEVPSTVRLRPDTGREIAAVANQQAPWYRPVDQGPRDAMGDVCFAVRNADDSIARPLVPRRGPDPARRGHARHHGPALVDLRPEALSQRWPCAFSVRAGARTELSQITWPCRESPRVENGAATRAPPLLGNSRSQAHMLSPPPHPLLDESTHNRTGVWSVAGRGGTARRFVAKGTVLLGGEQDSHPFQFVHGGIVAYPPRSLKVARSWRS